MKLKFIPLNEKEKSERWLKMTIEPSEFDCIDCHAHVYSWADRIGNRCAVCQWIHDMPYLTEKEIAEIRLITATPILEVDND